MVDLLFKKYKTIFIPYGVTVNPFKSFSKLKVSMKKYQNFFFYSFSPIFSYPFLSSFDHQSSIFPPQFCLRKRRSREECIKRMNLVRFSFFLISLKINENNKTRKFHNNLLGYLSTKNNKRVTGRCRCGKV